MGTIKEKGRQGYELTSPHCSAGAVADPLEAGAAHLAAWNTTAPLEKLPLDSNFAWLLCALLAATAWVIYVTFYNARVLGFLLTKVLNRLVPKAYIRIGGYLSESFHQTFYWSVTVLSF